MRMMPVDASAASAGIASPVVSTCVDTTQKVERTFLDILHSTHEPHAKLIRRAAHERLRLRVMGRLKDSVPKQTLVRSRAISQIDIRRRPASRWTISLEQPTQSQSNWPCG